MTDEKEYLEKSSLQSNLTEVGKKIEETAKQLAADVLATGILHALIELNGLFYENLTNAPFGAFPFVVKYR